MEEREELLKDFLSKFPNSPHPYDRGRFLKYALACAKIEGTINTDAMLDGGVTTENIEKYEVAYGWIRETYDFIMRNIDINDNDKVYLKLLQ